MIGEVPTVSYTAVGGRLETLRLPRSSTSPCRSSIRNRPQFWVRVLLFFLILRCGISLLPNFGCRFYGLNRLTFCYAPEILNMYWAMLRRVYAKTIKINFDKTTRKRSGPTQTRCGHWGVLVNAWQRREPASISTRKNDRTLRARN